MPLRGKRKKRSSGLTLPGYNYLGPFNSLDNGEPTNESDRAAKVHDEEYAVLQEQYGDFAPYFKFSDADQRFIDASGDDYGGRLGRLFFKGKKLIAPRIESTIEPHKKRLRGTYTQFSRIRSHPIAKSLLNLTPSEQARMGAEGETTGSGLAAGLKETPLDDVGMVFRGPPNYTFASLPWYYDRVDSLSSTSAASWAFRMTSPYDVSVTGTTTDDNAGAGVSNNTLISSAEPDSGAQGARWFNYYAGLYKYYHVVSCKWHLTIENMSTEPIWVHTYYGNETDRPRLATNRDILMWPDVRSHYVGAVANAITSIGIRENNEMVDNVENAEASGFVGSTPNYETGNHVVSRGRSPIISIGGIYKPGDYNREIRLDADVENWTAVTANPSLSERFYFRVKPQWDAQPLAAGDANTYGRPLEYRWVFKCEYLVEFKELVDGVKYPITDQPLTVTINQTTGAK